MFFVGRFALWFIFANGNKPEKFFFEMKISRISWTVMAASVVAWPVRAEKTDSLRNEKVHPIDEVVVTGSREATDLRKLPVSVSVVGRKRLDEAHRASLLPTLTERVPGLFITSRGIMGYGVSTGAAGGMTLRGVGNAPTTGLLVLIDGHPQYMGLMGHPIADAYRSNLAERVEVVRGPASMIYGSNAMGGVVNIVTRKMREEGVKTDLQAGYGSYNTLQTELTNRIRAGRFSSVVSGSYDRSDGHRKDMGFEQYGGSVRLGYELSKAWSVAADVQLTHFNAQNPGTVSEPLLDNISHITRGAASVTLDNRYERTSGSLSFFYNWGRHKIDDGYSAGEQPLDYRFRSNDRMMGVSWFQNRSFFRGNRTTFGLDYRHFGGKAWNCYLNGDPDKVSADKTMDEVAAYVDFRQNLTAWFTLDAGVRVDHHSHAGTEWVPQAGVSFQLPADAQIKLSASKGFRFPTIREMYMFPPQNPDLRPERLWNYEISFAQRLFDGKFSYGANLFYIDGENLIQTVRVDGRPLNVNTGRIENTGLELQAAWRVSSVWSIEANYSYLHMEYPVLAAPRNKLFVGADFVKGRWSASTGVQYVKGLYTSLNPTTAEEAFVLWNVSGRVQVARRCAVFVRGENLLAQRYEINAGFPMPKATFLGGIELNL